MESWFIRCLRLPLLTVAALTGLALPLLEPGGALVDSVRSVAVAQTAPAKPPPAKPPVAKPPVAKPAPSPSAPAKSPASCSVVTGSVISEAYGYKHVVALRNGCDKPVECEVWTDADPTPRHALRANPGQTVELITRIGSPASEVKASKECRFL